jgi:hypothetical protein
MNDEIDNLIKENRRRAQAAAWDAGFSAGLRYGQDLARYDVSRDSEYDEPTMPTNPYQEFT